MSVSTKALCALVTKTMVVQLLGFLEPEVGGARCVVVKMSDTKV
jgi:hypothetical protein